MTGKDARGRGPDLVVWLGFAVLLAVVGLATIGIQNGEDAGVSAGHMTITAQLLLAVGFVSARAAGWEALVGLSFLAGLALEVVGLLW